jgi:hypothetical protein
VEEIGPSDRNSSYGSIMNMLESMDKKKTTAEEQAKNHEMQIKVLEFRADKMKSDDERL